MQKIMEPAFEVVYLILVVTLGILIFIRARGRQQYQIFGIMAIILGCGDAFHLVPRVYAILTDGLENHTAALGTGKLVTSITMTIFYILLFNVWKLRYNKCKPLQLVVAYLLAAVRIILCLLPQNEWVSADSPLYMGIVRNIPFVLLGIFIIEIFYREAKRAKDKPFRFMWFAITLSFLFYIPVVLFADLVPALGMLMIPKTCAYVWIVTMGFLAQNHSSGNYIK